MLHARLYTCLQASINQIGTHIVSLNSDNSNNNNDSKKLKPNTYKLHHKWKPLPDNLPMLQSGSVFFTYTPGSQPPVHMPVRMLHVMLARHNPHWFLQSLPKVPWLHSVMTNCNWVFRYNCKLCNCNRINTIWIVHSEKDITDHVEIDWWYIMLR